MSLFDTLHTCSGKVWFVLHWSAKNRVHSMSLMNMGGFAFAT